MKICLRFLAIITAAGCVSAACGPADTSSGGYGGNNGSAGSGSGGSASGGSVGSGGSALGGSSSGGSVGSGGSVSGGGGSGGAVGSGGSVSGSAGGGVGGKGAIGGGSVGGAGGAAGGSTGGGGATPAGGTSGSYNPCPTNGDPCRILTVGDSITVGEVNQQGSYRIELFHKALMAKQKITYTGTLQNGPTMVDMMPFPRRYEATGGITIDGISTQITKNKTLDMPADLILVHIGTNDMYMGDPAGAPMRLGTLLDKLIAGMPNALIVVAKIIPHPFKAETDKYNAAIPALINTRAAAGKHITLVDLNTGFPSGDLGSDNVHPNAMGYAWMGDKWYDAIGSLFPK